MRVDDLALTVVLVTIFGWCVLADRLGRPGLTAPIVFVAAGFAFVQVLGLFEVGIGPELVKLIAEVTLVWVLFGDASGVRLSRFRRDLGTYVRLLGVGLPLTVALGTVIAVFVLGLDPWAALLLGAALAPTDAALGATVMSNPAVPEKVRNTLNVESGLNDGIATPIVLVAIAGVATDHGIAGVEGPGSAVLALALGALVGAVIGGLGGALTRTARDRGWLSEELAGPAVLALALIAYTSALLVEGNGFVAAFVGGLMFGNVAGRGGAKETYFVEQCGSLASMVSWLIFGAVAVPVIGAQWSWAMVLYAVLSLTVVRMLPVALALLGAGFDRYRVGFIGWFGPRGLASVVFALLALEDLHGVASDVVAVIALTVLLSVVAHGFSAGPLASRFRRAAPAAAGR
ncbi:cation:proton antiporter [Isoptericola sp. F-RaC21]|uniref:cation:proton antiporter n=1 Tax=Isoptericola sp. F-RaC21 TaxID=3141452 RepID=UPI00315C2C84